MSEEIKSIVISFILGSIGGDRGRMSRLLFRKTEGKEG